MKNGRNKRCVYKMYFATVTKQLVSGVGNTTSALSADRRGQSTPLGLAGTTSALSAMRRGPDPKQPMRRAFFLKTGTTNPYS